MVEDLLQVAQSEAHGAHGANVGQVQVGVGVTVTGVIVCAHVSVTYSRTVTANRRQNNSFIVCQCSLMSV